MGFPHRPLSEGRALIHCSHQLPLLGKAWLLFLEKYIGLAQSPAQGDVQGIHHGPFLGTRWLCVLLCASSIQPVSPNKNNQVTSGIGDTRGEPELQSSIPPLFALGKEGVSSCALSR